MLSKPIDQASQDAPRFTLAGHRPIVVCVDDDRQILSALERTLRNDAYETWTTDGPHNVLEWLRTGRVSVLMADQSMPGMKGTELLKSARELSPQTARILVTAVPEDPLVLKAMETIEFRMMRKPWDDLALRGLVRERLQVGVPSA